MAVKNVGSSEHDLQLGQSANGEKASFWKGKRITALKDAAIVGLTAAVGFAAYKAFETAPLWVPVVVGFLTGIGPVGWGLLAGAAVITVIALGVLAIKNKDPKETILAMLERCTIGRVSSAGQALPLLVTSIIQGLRTVKNFVAGDPNAKKDAETTGLFGLKTIASLKDMICAPSFEEYNKVRHLADNTARPFVATMQACKNTILTGSPNNSTGIPREWRRG